MQVTVKFVKVFTKGILQGLEIETVLPCANMQSAQEYLKHCEKHAEMPCQDSFVKHSAYLIKNPTIIRG